MILLFSTADHNIQWSVNQCIRFMFLASDRSSLGLDKIKCYVVGKTTAAAGEFLNFKILNIYS